ncbi:hypothetical protein [Acetobacter sp.]|jgi:hypothetical protein|uniref:hypothetical protein n=1 Tax=Acetobacter sp. TaxID=440 RepID=UPI0025C3E4D1|nr:hypothetical protein [Acetobacter sp.]MCH4091019.1 hypothetical protein [Acetobacter sp.]MCI1300202.1 hypothetical protein [Acetobacter sp.]MCI1316130.1 hypothetical protein [Acetobacter sp.]
MNRTSLNISDLLFRAGKVSEHIENLLIALQDRLAQREPDVCSELQNLDLATQLSAELTALLRRLSLDGHVIAAGQPSDVAAIVGPVKLDAVSSILAGESPSKQEDSSEVELF